VQVIHSCASYFHICHSYFVLSSSPVATFAVKSGDFAALSTTDLCIIALTKTLHNRFQQKAVVSLADAPPSSDEAKTVTSNPNREKSANGAALPVKNAWGKPRVAEKISTADVNGETDPLFENDAFPALSSYSIPEEEGDEDLEGEVDPSNSADEGECEEDHDNELVDIENESDGSAEESETTSANEIENEELDRIAQEQNSHPETPKQADPEEVIKSSNSDQPTVGTTPTTTAVPEILISSCGCDALHSDQQQLSAAELAEFTPVLSHHSHGHQSSTSKSGRGKRKEAKRQLALETRSVGSFQITSSAASTGARRKLTKDEASDDGVGWISATNMDQASQITRWTTKKVPKTSVDFEGSPVSASVQSQEKVAQAKSKPAPPTSKANQAANPKTPSSTKSLGQAVVANDSKVACCTSDFAMQNVLLQLGLVVISVDGLRIRRLRTAVLRCNACYHVHSGSAKELTRIFCAKCGGNTLSRVNATLAADGTIELHLKKGYTLSTKGTQYSMPAPGKQPRFQGELLTREDQLLSGIWKQKSLRVKKEVKSVFGEDVTNEVGLHLNKGFDVKVGLGKQNPNAKKGRERRGKRKVNNAIK